VLLQELVPKSDIERAYAQACCWNPQRAWSRATRELYRDRTGIASAEYLAMAKTSVEKGDYETAVTTIAAVEQYSAWLTPAEKISLVRVLCDILALVLEKSDPEAAELQKSAVQTAVHFIAGFSRERNAVLNSLTELRKTGAVDLISEQAVRTQTKRLRADFEQGKHFCGKIINETDKRPRFIRSLDRCTRKLVNQINKNPDNCYHIVVIGMLSEYQLCLEFLSDRVDDDCIKRCKTKIQKCLLAVCKELCTIKENRNYCGQILDADLSNIDGIFALHDSASSIKITHANETLETLKLRAETAADHALRRTSDEDLVALRRHLVTMLSLCALSDQNSTAAEITLTFSNVLAASRAPLTTSLLRFCRDQRCVFGRLQWQMKRNPDIYLANLILLASENFLCAQEDLALLLLNQVLDAFQTTTIDLGFIGALWQYSVTHLPPYWSVVYPKFIVPLAALTELHMGDQPGLEPIYRTALTEIRTAVGVEAEHSLAKQLVSARVNLQEEKSNALTPLLRLIAHNASVLDDTAECLEFCKRILVIKEKQIDSAEQIDIELFEDLLFCAKYQMRYAHDLETNLEQTYHLVEKSLDICLENKTVTASLIFLLGHFSVFTVQFGENIESCPPGSSGVSPASTLASAHIPPASNFFVSLIERIGENAIIEAVEKAQNLAARSLQEQSLIMLFKLSQRNSWQLHHKLIPLLSKHASYCLSQHEYDKAGVLYDLVLSTEVSKPAQLAKAFLLARDPKLDEALQLLEQALEPPFPPLDRNEIDRLSFVLKECIRIEKFDAASKIMAALLPSEMLNEPRTVAERLGDLIYFLVSESELQTAEYLLGKECHGHQELFYDLLVSYLSGSAHYAGFVNLLWQPKADKEPIYPRLLELKRQVEARHGKHLLRPDPFVLSRSYETGTMTETESATGSPVGKSKKVTVVFGDSSADLESLRKTLESHLTEAWFPPRLGGAPILVTFIIGLDGNPMNIKVTQSSGNPLADSAALRAATHIAPIKAVPREVEAQVGFSFH